MAQLGAVGVVNAGFSSILETASKIQQLGDKYYKYSQEREDFPGKVKLLNRHYEIWYAAVTEFGATDEDVMDTVKDCGALFTKYASLLKNEHNKLLDVEMESKQPKSFIHACVTRCCPKAIAFPGTIARSLERLVDSLKAISELCKLKEEARDVAAKQALRTSYSLPFGDDNRYVQLEDTETEICCKLQNSNGPPLVLLHGAPGRGKSTVARNLALYYNNSKRGITSCSFFARAVFLECGTKVETSVKQLELLKYLADNGVSSDLEKLKEQNIAQLLKSLLKLRKVLIILDDVWKGPFLQDMVKLFGSEVKCLVTSQQEDVCFGLSCPQSDKVHIQEILPDVARKILASHVGFEEQRIPPKEEIENVVDKIIADAAGNPLALASVVSAINVDEKEDPKEWKDVYTKFANSLDTIPPSYVFEKYARSFRAATTLSVNSLSEDAKKLLVVMLLCQGPSVPEEVIRLFDQFQGVFTFSKKAKELQGRELVQITSQTDNSERSWSIHSLQNRFLEEDEDMRKQKDEVFEILTGFSWMVDNKPTMESEIDTELQNEDEVSESDIESQSDDAESAIDTRLQKENAYLNGMLNAGLCALYFREKWATKAATKAASQLRVPAGMFDDLRRTAFEPITKLLGESTGGQWTPALRTAAKQAFLKYFYHSELDDQNISALLDMRTLPAVQIAALVAIHDICSIGETPTLIPRSKLLASLLRFISIDGSSGPIFGPGVQEMVTSTLSYLAYENGFNLYQIADAPGALAALVQLLSKEDHHTLQANAALVLQNIACGRQSDRYNIVNESGAIAALVKSLSNDNNPSLQRRAAAAIASIAYGETSATLRILENGRALAGLVASLSNDDNRILQQRAAGVFAILAKRPSVPDLEMWEEEGVIVGLVGSLFKEDHPGLQENAAVALENLVTNKMVVEPDVFQQIRAFTGAFTGAVQSVHQNANSALQGLAEGWSRKPQRRPQKLEWRLMEPEKDWEHLPPTKLKHSAILKPKEDREEKKHGRMNLDQTLLMKPEKDRQEKKRGRMKLEQTLLTKPKKDQQETPVLVNTVLQGILPTVSSWNVASGSKSAHLTDVHNPVSQMMPMASWLRENSSKSTNLLETMQKSKLKMERSILEDDNQYSSLQGNVDAALAIIADRRARQGEKSEYHIFGDMELRWS